MMIIRPESTTDFPAITALLDAAFDGTYESRLVEQLRGTDAYLPQFTLVGEEDGRVVAFVMLSVVSLETVDSRNTAVAIGPVAVSPDLQNRGLGSTLMRELLRLVDERGEHDTVILLGHPQYYTRFGFVPASDVGIYPELPWAEAAFMARQENGSLKKGMVRYSSAFAIGAKTDEVSLRRASEIDMETVARVFAIAFRHSLPFLPNLHTAEEDVAYFSGKVFSENEVWVAVDGLHQTIGFIGFDQNFVNHLYVLPIAQGHGVGKALLQHAMSARSHLQLWTFQRNALARAFYKRMGFSEIRLTDGAANEENEPDVLLEWNKT
jgi:putative acetyltransferase